MIKPRDKKTKNPIAVKPYESDMEKLKIKARNHGFVRKGKVLVGSYIAELIREDVLK